MENRSRSVAFALVGLFTLALGAVFHVMSALLIPFAIAIFIVFMVNPVVGLLQRLKVPLMGAVLLVLIAVGGIFTGLGYLIFLNTTALIDVFPDRFAGFLERLLFITKYLETHNIDLNYEYFLSEVNAAQITHWIGSISGSFISFFGTTVLIVLYSVLMIMETYSIQARIKTAVPNNADKISKTLSTIGDQIKGYMVSKSLINLFGGVLTALVCWLMGMDVPILWGILAFLLSYIPTLGAFLSVIFPTAMALIQFETMTPLILIFVLLALIHGIIGNVLEPRIYGSSLKLSPLMIILSLIFWTWIWGIPGAFLSVPILAAAKIITANFKSTQPISILLGQ